MLISKLQYQRVYPVICRTNSCKADNLASYQRGTGRRSSFSGKVVTVFGANGFLGRMVVNRLGRIGTQIIVPYRCDSYHVDSLKPCAALGQILFQPFHLEDEKSIESAIKYSDVVVNLIGKEYETRNFSFEKVHCEGAGRIARISKQLGVEAFIHFSSLNVSPRQEFRILKTGSSFLQSKALGEEAVLSEFPDATIVRPADMAGFSDKFLYYFADTYRRTVSGSLPLWREGQETVKQPVLAYDVVTALMELIERPLKGQIVELTGPVKYRLDELVRFIIQSTDNWDSRITNMTGFYKYKIQFLESVRLITRRYTLDKLERECISDRPMGYQNFSDLGITPESVLPYIAYFLRPFVKNANAKKYPYVFRPPVVPTAL